MSQRGTTGSSEDPEYEEDLQDLEKQLMKENIGKIRGKQWGVYNLLLSQDAISAFWRDLASAVFLLVDSLFTCVYSIPTVMEKASVTFNGVKELIKLELVPSVLALVGAASTILTVWGKDERLERDKTVRRTKRSFYTILILLNHSCIFVLCVYWVVPLLKYMAVTVRLMIKGGAE